MEQSLQGVKTVRKIAQTKSDETDQHKYRQLRVAAYCRVSTDSDEQEMSFEAQVEYYTDKIMRNPQWRLAGIFADEGISGTQAKKRPQFMQMIRLCEQGRIDMIITKSVSRFARNTVDCIEYVRRLKARGIPIIFEKEGLNTMQTTSEIYLSLHGIFAQSESESLSGNVRMGKEMSAKKGIVTFSYKNFLGYRRGADNQPEIDPEEAEIVRLIFDRYLAGDSLTVIQRLLENRGVLSPTGKATWSVTTIRSILTNEKYKGDALLQKTYVIDCITHKSKKNDDRPQYYVENNHPAIVSKEIFDRVQEEMARRTSKRKVKEVGTKTQSGKYSGKYALTDLLICGHCGTPYRRCTWSKRGKKKIVWRCISRLDYGKKYCPDSSTVEEESLQNAIVECIKQVIKDESGYAVIESLKHHIGMYFTNDDENSTAEDEAKAAELIQAITQAAKTGHFTAEMEGMVEELNRLKAVIKDKKSKQSSTEKSTKRMEEIMVTIEELKDTPIAFDNYAIRQIIDCIKVISEDEITIIFKGGFERTVPLK